jgi:hypothetical protein
MFHIKGQSFTRVAFMSDKFMCLMCQVAMPPWIRGDVLDVRRTLSNWKANNVQETTAVKVSIIALSRLC